MDRELICLIICFIVGIFLFYLLKQSCGCQVVEGAGAGDNSSSSSSSCPPNSHPSSRGGCSCDDGYTVADRGFGCVPDATHDDDESKSCPPNSHPSFEGRCSCDDGYTTNHDFTACIKEKVKDPKNSCRWAYDGVCDEPGRCPPGTDSADCEKQSNIPKP